MSILVRYAPVSSSTVEQYDEVMSRLQESGEMPAPCWSGIGRLLLPAREVGAAGAPATVSVDRASPRSPISAARRSRSSRRNTR